jgi:hypothetical protein
MTPSCRSLRDANPRHPPSRATARNETLHRGWDCPVVHTAYPWGTQHASPRTHGYAAFFGAEQDEKKTWEKHYTEKGGWSALTPSAAEQTVRSASGAVGGKPGEAQDLTIHSWAPTASGRMCASRQQTERIRR